MDKFDCPDKEIKSVQSKAKRLFRRYQTTLKSCSNKVLFKYFYELRWITLVIGVQTRLKSNTSQKYLEKFIKNERNYAGGKGDKSICVTQWKGRVFRTEWFEKPVKHVFADIQINIPSDYDTYLKLLYGDYMQLPAENKRTGGHKPYYMNFEKSMTVEEINQLPQMQQQ